MGRLGAAWRALVGRKPSRTKMREMVQAAYYAAAADSETMDFSFAKDVGLNASLVADLQKVRMRCRYELKQNGIAKGLPRIYANSVVGTGPHLSLIGQDIGWNRLTERAFAAWCKHSDYLRGLSLGMHIHAAVRQLFPCGEYFLARRVARDGAVRLRYLLIRPDRVKTPGNVPKGKTISQGVEVDGDGIPVAYWVLPIDPDSGASSVPTDPVSIPADQIIHVFYNEDPIQHRGEPWLAAGLPTFHKIRRYDDASVAAAIVAAKFAAFLVADSGADGLSAEDILPEAVMEIQDGMVSVLPPGYKPQQIDPKQPQTNASEWRRDQIGNAAAGMALPVNIATGDSSRGSFASSRFDGVTLTQDGLVVRKLVEDLHLSRVFADFLAEATAAGIVPTPNEEPAPLWLWPREDRHTDPQKQASSDETRLKNGQATVRGLAMERGQDAEDFLEDLDKDIAWFHERGLIHPIEVSTAKTGGKADESQNAQDSGQSPE